MGENFEYVAILYSSENAKYKKVQLLFCSESSSDEKLQETDAKDKPLSDDVDSADDVLDTINDIEEPVKRPRPGNPFTQTEALPTNSSALNPFTEHANPFNQNTDPFAQNADPFADFDSVAPHFNPNDPFTSVVTRLPEHPAPIHQNPPSELAPSVVPPQGLKPQTNSRSLTPSPQSPVSPNSSLTNNQGPLIDLGENDSSSTDPRSTSSPTGITSDDLLFSSGSHSSTGSGKRFSSSASSSSDSGVKLGTGSSSTKVETGHTDKKGLVFMPSR